MNREEELKQKVLEKIEKEYDDFIGELSNCSSQVIIERAYEKVVKEEMKDKFASKDLSELESKALLKNDGILEEFYDDWLNTDGNFSEMLEISMDDTIDIMVDSYKQKIKDQNKQTR